MAQLRVTIPNRWFQLALGIVAMVTVANLQYGWVLFTAPLEARFHWGRPALSLALSIFLVTETVLVPAAGWLVDKYGPRPVMIAGSLLVALAWVANSVADSLTLLYAAMALGGLGVGAVYGVCVGNSLKWFPDHRGLAVGLTTAAYGIGSAITAQPIQNMIAAAGYETAFFRFGLAQGLTVLIVAVLILAPTRPLRAGRAGPPQSARDWRPIEMLKSRVFWLMYLLYVSVYAAGLMAVAELPAIASDFGIARAPVGFVGLLIPALSFALAIDRVLSGVTRPLLGWISDHIGREITMAAAFAVQGLGIWALYAFGRDPASFVILSGLVYFAGGQVFSLFPAASADSFGTKYAATNAGFLYTAKGVGSLLAPLGAYISQAAGSWHGVFLFAGGVQLIAAAAAILLLGPWRRRAIRG